MKYLNETGLRHLIAKIFAKFAEMENSLKTTAITNEEIDTIWEEQA